MILDNIFYLHVLNYSQFADHQLSGRGLKAVLLLDGDLHLLAARGDGDHNFYADSLVFFSFSFFLFFFFLSFLVLSFFSFSFCLHLSNDQYVIRIGMRDGGVGYKFVHNAQLHMYHL